MKKGILALITIFSCTFLEANTPPEGIEKLASKVILQNTKGYFVLADGSCWKTIAFVKRWRSLSEWWNGVELVPQNYECLPNDWALGSPIEIYTKYDNLTVKESDADNESELKQCTHLLYNKRTGQVLFAISLEPAECIASLYKEARKDGYDDGYATGRKQSYKNAEEVYENGRLQGYKEGFKAGLNSVKGQDHHDAAKNKDQASEAKQGAAKDKNQALEAKFDTLDAKLDAMDAHFDNLWD